MEDNTKSVKFGTLQLLWIKLCVLFVRAFYRKVEVSGANRLLDNTPIILCANHSNALADAVLLQYTNSHLIHPLARSGLFKNPLTKPILSIWQAVPVYRRQDTEDGQVDNHSMFIKAYEMLQKNQILMIFPEGQSHSDNEIKQIKTGLARIILGYKEKYNQIPLVIPVGLNFSKTTKFRSNVYINFGQAIEVKDSLNLNSEKDVKDLTSTIMNNMRKLVLESNEINELLFISQVERFFALRNKENRKRTLGQKFRVQKLILSVKSRLNELAPDKILSIHRHLNQFNRLCNKLGINDYNLNINYSSSVIERFIVKSLFSIVIVLPLAIIGFIHSFIPYILTKLSETYLAKGRDQSDTVKILSGTLFFSVFWISQIFYIYNTLSIELALIYAVLLVPTALSALIIIHDQAQIINNLKVFYIIIRHRNLRRYLIRKRKGIEKEFAVLINLARQHKLI